jgi:Predicted membrane protein
MLDASATGYGIDIHPVHYVEQHVVGSGLIEATGTAFSMYLLKLAVLIPAVYVLEMYRREGNPDLWHLILLAMIVVGMAPGIRDLVRMVLYV